MNKQKIKIKKPVEDNDKEPNPESLRFEDCTTVRMWDFKILRL